MRHSWKLDSKMKLTVLVLACSVCYVFEAVVALPAGGKCESTADCVAPNVCSKWGWCQWTKIYGIGKVDNLF